MQNMRGTCTYDVEIDAFLQRALAATLDDSLSADQLTALTLETGSYGVR